ncbi:hypothetical protein K402DRAFT_401538 [Aulographum hederae CBS 113979]|uniref:Velvet domain-containing protein n=1 Tax=Aulographum hederae CBS 113979 TaxID=1176131 RepID=A0A6G1HA12_9PEZI|nr:hypothetical protein K402DRAFT_401538 [Aulographum hederae CBS 113979]
MWFWREIADRRPVDPPPIVELRVFEDGEERTFSYNANFFLFATLENARTIAQGRVQPSTTPMPVLTGTPVAGMAYLDRPSPAGYFIFPDLSVRHEGKYRLSFALFEELKDPKDMDSEEGNGFLPNQTHVSHRLEVKSAPFTVFSAKKFPGLTESTALSRMVAEQGCRVRIRRDVRMRRRENKGAKDDWDENEYGENNYDRGHQTPTPDAYGQNASTPIDNNDRPRSVSNASVASYGVPQRRTSMEQMSQNYNQQHYPPHIGPQAPQNTYPQQMSYPQSQPQYQGHYPQQQQNMMQPPQVPFQNQYQAPPPMPMPPQMAPNQMASPNYGYMQNQFPPPTYDQNQHVRQNSMEYPPTPTDYRRVSMQQQQNVPQPQMQQYHASNQMMNAPFGSLDDSYSRHNSMTQPPQMQPTNPMSMEPSSLPSTSAGLPSLAPLKTLQPMEKNDISSPAYATPVTGSSENMQTPIDYQNSMPKFAVQPQTNPGTKRTFSSSFDTQHMEQPLRQGARPSVPYMDDPETRHLSQMDGTMDEESVFEESAMSYRRADGTERRRRVPLTG